MTFDEVRKPVNPPDRPIYDGFDLVPLLKNSDTFQTPVSTCDEFGKMRFESVEKERMGA